ncbi:exodeoxyribonuclease VII large subunit [Ruminococcus sp. FC2018]|uniref:exodeoxyribonuclease VII large subunit n=1 Tax=Ruminococcus sp. FC2018 TaxID=1410617 RepID=UPI000491FBAF|nr:exodeoxyribonuclease VII large subunit [Ruminococcus sp. FC2018]
MSSILTVSQLNEYVSFKLKSDVKLKGVCVKGEVSNFTLNRSGHAYFSVKDDRSCIKAVMFANNFSRLKNDISNGMSVLVTGNVELYEPGGTFQIIVTDVNPLGSGLLYMQIEAIKEKLAKSGVFDDAAKTPVPLFPRKIAVISSSTGAALQDILNVIGRRFPICQVSVFHTRVQGENASDDICNSIKTADDSGADTIIIARGGGSLEDLMPFNSESVALAVHGCKTPVISAVGHETDTTLVDYAADLRAPTPSAAAELATPDKSELFAAVDKLSDMMTKALNLRIDRAENDVSRYISRLRLFSPQRKLENNAQRIEMLSRSLANSINSLISKLESSFEKDVVLLEGLSPLKVISRGYSIVSNKDSIIRSPKDLKENDRINIRFSHGSADVSISDIVRKEE